MASRLVARRLGRIASGCVLLLGLAGLLYSASRPPSWHGPFRAASILTATWIAALAGNALVRAIATRLELRDPEGRLFAASVVVPAVGIALTLPITLHMPFALLLGGAAGFEDWLQVCIAITSFAHVAFAILVARHADQLVLGRRAWSPHVIYVVTIGVSCVPFAVLAMIPPLLVAVTGLPLFPMLRRLKLLVEQEREEARSLPEVLPTARVV